MDTVIRQWCPTCQKATPTRISWGHEYCAVCQPDDPDDDYDEVWEDED